ncbi:MAG: PD-(D/E)XK nuclease-like domain-containing protein [Bdellovibrio sp.]
MRLGVFTEKAEDYHAQKAYVSSSPLRKMRKSPAHFYDAWQGENAETTHEMEKGTAIHSLLLEQDIWRYVRRPVKEDGSLVRSNSKEYAAFLTTLTPEQVPVEPEFFDNFEAMLDSFVANKKAMEMLNKAKVELSVYAQDPTTMLYVKARPDIWGAGFAADLKSTTNMDSFERNIFALGYDIQAAHYLETIKAATGEEINEFYFIAYEQKSPFGSQIFRLSESDLNRARGQRHLLLSEVAACMKDNSWPSYSDEIREATRPAYMQDDEVSFAGVG